MTKDAAPAPTTDTDLTDDTRPAEPADPYDEYALIHDVLTGLGGRGLPSRLRSADMPAAVAAAGGLLDLLRTGAPCLLAGSDGPAGGCAEPATVEYEIPTGERLLLCGEHAGMLAAAAVRAGDPAPAFVPHRRRPADPATRIRVCAHRDGVGAHLLRPGERCPLAIQLEAQTNGRRAAGAPAAATAGPVGAELRELLAAVREAIDIPHPATMGDRDEHLDVLSARAMHATIAISAVLDGDPAARTAGDIAWRTAYLRQQLANHPTDSYRHWGQK